HRAGLVDRYVIYMAPAFLGGDDGLGMFAGNGSAAMSELWRGRLVSLTRLADDVKMVIEPTDRSIRLTGSATAYQ
ncbi:MAG: dihydrofolate reductase family protein, partial [Acidimicrobiales bacterium]